MKINLYYTAPSNESFDELKEMSMKVWGQKDDTYGYASKKIDRIKDIQNIRDNFMYMVAMFDIDNQSILAMLLSRSTLKEVNDRFISGGQPDEYNPFNKLLNNV